MDMNQPKINVLCPFVLKVTPLLFSQALPEHLPSQLSLFLQVLQYQIEAQQIPSPQQHSAVNERKSWNRQQEKMHPAFSGAAKLSMLNRRKLHAAHAP